MEYEIIKHEDNTIKYTNYKIVGDFAILRFGPYEVLVPKELVE